MIAVHLESGQVSVVRADAPEPRDGFALIRMLLAGICNTDIELERGYYGFSGTPGHEFVGEVAHASDRSLVGKRVAGEINLTCGHCDSCRSGLARHCPHRTVLGIVRHPGAFAEFLTLPERNLHILPDEISNEEAVFIEPLAAACEILDQVQIPRGTPIAVLGDGKLGLLIAQVLHAHGAQIVVYGRHQQKLSILRQRGIEITTEAHPGRLYPVVVEASGSSSGLRQAIGMTQPRGTIVLKSTVYGEVSFDSAPLVVNEISLIGSRCGRFEPAIKLLADKAVDVRPLISSEFPLSRAVEAFAEAQRPGVLKVFLRNDQPDGVS